jgi:trk system potassium uptake protein TrkH
MADGVPILTTISACAATIGNVGPGFGEVGPVLTYAGLSGFTKIIFSLLMLLGRLELYTILVLFIPVFWKR